MIYSSLIIGCYGLIEETVDSIVMSTVESLVAICQRHSDLPAEIRETNRRLILECLRSGDKARTRLPVDERTALSSLGASANDPPALVAAAFTFASANYRLPYTRELFSRLLIRLPNDIAGENDADALSVSGFSNYESFLDDLVQRRNDIAHSYTDNQLLSLDILSSYVDNTHNYLARLINLVDHYLLDVLLSTKEFRIGSVVRMWTGRVGIRMDSGSISVGDRLILMNADRHVLHRVVSLQSEGIDSEYFEYDGIRPLNVSAAVDFTSNNCLRWDAFIIPDEFKRYWIEADVLKPR
ncbi:MAE_28990/MAE_18760 family HEPN-like nuclease [Brevibacterium casei]|uniref:MAE_28990/MAE_18760 family HEPN-like nuclease n=1 Tax=Brevibacterium casei TaxID=33889 RepID=UPI001CBA68F4